jgi:hypothetical protein
VLIGVAIALAIIVVFIGFRLVQRRRRDEIRSIHHYHDRLDTLHVEQHDRGGSVHLVADETAPEAHPAPDRPRLDPEAAHLDPWAPAPAPQEEPRRHDRTWALERMEPKARIDTGTIVIISIVVAVLVAIALVGYQIQRERDKTSSPTTSTTTTTGAKGGDVVSAPSKIEPLSFHGGVVDFAMPNAGTNALKIAAINNAVTASVRSPSSAATPITKTIAAATSATFELTGLSVVVIGVPDGSSVSLDGVHVAVPEHASPLTIHFLPKT